MTLAERLAALVQQKEQRLVAARAEVQQLESDLTAIAALVEGTRQPNLPTMPVVHTAAAWFPPAVGVNRVKSGSSVDWATKVLQEAGAPLHIDVLIAKIEEVSGEPVKKPTLVSNLSRYVNDGNRFVRTAESTYGLKGRDDVAA